MSIFGMFKGAPKDEKKRESDTWQSLSNIATEADTTGAALGKKGAAETGRATDFFGGVLSGDRTKLAPGVNAAVEGADAAKREQGQMGTARGGGTNADNQQIEQHTRQLVSALMGEAQTGAADKLAAIGSGDTNAMLSETGIASGTQSNLSSLLHTDVKEKNESAAKMWGSLISGGLNLATAGMSGGFGKKQDTSNP